MLALFGWGALLLSPTAFAQNNWGEVAGRITDAGAGSPVISATVLVEGTNFGTAADEDGRYRLRLPEGRYALLIRAVGYEAQTDSVRIRRGTTITHDVALAQATFEMEGALVEGRGVEDAVGVSTIDPEDIRAMPTPVADALRGVKVQLGVTSNNETSNAYSVRGGGYNENQFFVDGFEIYRPLRTQQGEQEGLGLVNADLAETLTLYAGGFPSRYGGKLSSVLDVSYARPTGPIGGSIYGSTLDGGASLRGGLADGRVGLAIAARSARPRRFFATQELEGVYDPDFRDVQGLIDVQLADGHDLHVLGMVARHRFRLEPSQRETTFGIFPNQLRTVAFQFDGLEEDGYDVYFGGARLTNRLSQALRVEHSLSYFETDEFETYDVAGDVTLFRLERDPDAPPNDPFEAIQTGQARQRDIGDNRVSVQTLTGGGRYRLGVGRHAAETGWHLRRLTFDDRLFETSALEGRDEMGNPVSVTVDSLNDAATLDTWQAAAWAEDAWDLLAEPGRLVVTAGVRADYFEFNDEWTVSPRFSARYRLSDLTTLSVATGLYHQAPTYRELRGEPAPGESILGALNRDLESQRSFLVTAGAEHLFPNTRFSLRGEAWYKGFDNLISYELENVRVVYSGENDTKGYAYGLDLQVRGELVPGLESWLNYGFLMAREEFQEPFITERNDGTRARPTDRRHNISLFVQDYVPGDDTWSLHLRTLFGSGLPFTPPAVGDVIDGVSVFESGERSNGRYPEYFRFDMGATKRVRVGRSPAGRPLMLRLTAEVLNVFNMKNTITFDFVDSGEGFFEGVPTRLTPRTVNVRARLDF
ncbi:MAG: TonB-dependent receptor [Rhodothermaceae bacterium]|nr:TonB-dependent receptor [Rhodothermaceae bacterium]